MVTVDRAARGEAGAVGPVDADQEQVVRAVPLQPDDDLDGQLGPGTVTQLPVQADRADLVAASQTTG